MLIGLNYSSISQTSLSYYLPDSISYDHNIPTPESILGHEIGEWHITHDNLVAYMRAVSKSSDRVKLYEQGKSYEGRPTLLMAITSVENHKKLASWKEEHAKLCDPSLSNEVTIKEMPVVIWLGYSVHGNEASGSNSAPLVVYYLTAGKSKNIDNTLEKSIILIDPSFNPDGLQRFSTWVNMHKNNSDVVDAQSREFHEVWPGGRTNHYWFDLNRDWLFGQHPESRGRISSFQNWHPNVLTDHHEMGSNSTFFFQPGVPSRKNPTIPNDNVTLTEKIAAFHATALDSISSLYFTKERFDDYYYGKGSTYPDIQGSIGILFEQASSRGHKRNTANGILTFPFGIRNHFITSLSTIKASIEYKDDLLNYQRDFFIKSVEKSTKDPIKAYVFTEQYDNNKLSYFIDVLLQHKIKIYRLKKDLNINNNDYLLDKSYIVPLDQYQYRLIKSLFETTNNFSDSVFYDVSTWTLPLAFNIQYNSFKGSSKDLLGEIIHNHNEVLNTNNWIGGRTEIAYVFKWDDYLAPKALYKLQKENIITKVSSKPFRTSIATKTL